MSDSTLYEFVGFIVCLLAIGVVALFVWGIRSHLKHGGEE